MLDWFSQGGMMMLPLTFCSILALGIVMERLWVLRKRQAVPDGLSVSLVRDLKTGALNQATMADYQKGSSLGRLLTGAISESTTMNRQALSQRLEAHGKIVVSDLYKHLNLLGSVAAIAPLLGLLGTVLGMIDVFAVIMEAGTGQARPLAGGISEALVSTATGLSIGIPALFFSRYLHRRAEVITLQLEKASAEFLELLLPNNAESKA